LPQRHLKLQLINFYKEKYMSPSRNPRALAPLLLCWLLACVSPAHGSLDPDQVWTASGGQVRLELRADYLPDFGLELVHEGQRVSRVVSVDRTFNVADNLVIEAPYGNFERIRSGEIRLDTG
jgi:hypothetical protein